MQYLILAASLIFELFSCGILRNAFCKDHVKNNADLCFFNAISNGISFVCLLAIYSLNHSLCIPSMYTILMGLGFGLITALSAIFDMKALECGPLSYTKVIVYCSMVLPSLSGAVFYGEEINTFQYVGIILMVLSFILAVDKRNDSTKANLKWFIYCILAFVLYGSIGIMQKVHQTSVYKEEISIFLLIAFAFSTIFSWSMTVFWEKKERSSITLLKKGKRLSFALISLVCGVGIAFCNHYNMYLSGVIDAIILFPVLNGGAMILVTASGLIIWKEKLTKKQTIGLIIGVISMICLCNVIQMLTSLI